MKKKYGKTLALLAALSAAQHTQAANVGPLMPVQKAGSAQTNGVEQPSNLAEGEYAGAQNDVFAQEGEPVVTKWVSAWGSFLGRAVEGYTSISAVETSLQSRPLDLYENKEIQRFLKLYRGELREQVERGVARSGKYLPLIQRIFLEEGLPKELAYLAIVESNLNPDARSSAQALGLWQMLAPTAIHFGLAVQSPWYDERLDPELSTRAAARMLVYLHDRYGNWELALAAYNSGEGRVDRAIRQALTHTGRMNYWELDLPQETQSYVPAFMAMVLLFKDLETHGFQKVTSERLVRYEVLRGAYFTTFEEIEARTGISRERLAQLNPAWRKGFLPASHMKSGQEVTLRLPAANRRLFEKSLAERSLAMAELVSHKASKGENLRKLSKKYNVSLGELTTLNRFGARHVFKKGEKVLIPLSTSEWSRRNQVQTAQPLAQPVTLNTEHTVEPGESLAAIARRYGVSLKELMRWNRMDTAAVRPYQRLKIMKPMDMATNRSTM